MRPISNVVDVTNYVMLALGNPLHDFDFETLGGGRIVVRRARAGEEFTSLDGNLRKLDPADLVIADAERAIAFAGIMGGLDTEVTESTTSVLLEAANFEPGTILWSLRAPRFAPRARTAGRRGRPLSRAARRAARHAALVELVRRPLVGDADVKGDLPEPPGSRTAPAGPTGSSGSRSPSRSRRTSSTPRVRRRARLGRPCPPGGCATSRARSTSSRRSRASTASSDPLHPAASERDVRPPLAEPAAPPARRGRARRRRVLRGYTLSLVARDPDPEALGCPTWLSSEHGVLRTTLLDGLSPPRATTSRSGTRRSRSSRSRASTFRAASSCRTSTGASAQSRRAATAGQGRGRDPVRGARHRAGARADAAAVPAPRQGRRARGGLGRRAPSGALLEGEWGVFELDLDTLFAQVPERVEYEDVVSYPAVHQDSRSSWARRCSRAS